MMQNLGRMPYSVYSSVQQNNEAVVIQGILINTRKQAFNLLRKFRGSGKHIKTEEVK